MIEKYGFVYIWRDRKNNMYYIGCHWGHVDDKYICSSNRMRISYKRRPQDFKRRILETNIKDKSFLLEREYLWLQQIKPEELSKKYYNANNKKFGHWFETQDKSGKNHPKFGKSVSDETRKKLSESHKGQIPWNKGKTGIYSEETRQKISDSHKGNTYNKGNKHSEDTKQKMSELRRGKEPWNKGVKTGPNPEQSNRMKGKEPWNKGKKCEQLSGDKNGATKLKGKSWFYNTETNKREWVNLPKGEM